MLVLVVAWAHAMIGVHFWLGVRHWYARLQPAALVVAVLFPVLALLGAIEAGRQVIALAADPGWTREAFTLPPPETLRALETITEILSWFFAGVVTAVVLAPPAPPALRPPPRPLRLGLSPGPLAPRPSRAPPPRATPPAAGPPPPPLR